MLSKCVECGPILDDISIKQNLIVTTVIGWLRRPKRPDRNRWIIEFPAFILISIPSLITGMSINQFSVCIVAVMAVFVLTVTGISFTPTSVAQNMTGGNMTTEGTSMTGMNETGSVSSSNNIIQNNIPHDLPPP